MRARCGRRSQCRAGRRAGRIRPAAGRRRAAAPARAARSRPDGRADCRRAELVYADEDRIDAAGQRSDWRFKPAWSPPCSSRRLSRSAHADAPRDACARSAAGAPIADGAQHDLLLRLTARGGAARDRASRQAAGARAPNRASAPPIRAAPRPGRCRAPRRASR